MQGELFYLPWQMLGIMSPNSQTLFLSPKALMEVMPKDVLNNTRYHSGTFPIRVARAYSVLYFCHFWPSNDCWDPLSSKTNVSWAATFSPGSKSDLSVLTGVCFWGLINFSPCPEQLYSQTHSIDRPVPDMDILFLVFLHFPKRKGIECNNLN